MKKQMYVLLIALVAVITNQYAQEMGNFYHSNNDYANSQYNNTTQFSKTNRNAATSASVDDNNAITIEINGLMNLSADSYVAMFNIVQAGQTMDSVERNMNKRISGFIQKLKQININEENIKTDLISFVPSYEVKMENKIFSKSYNEVPTGFEMQKNITIAYKDPSKINEIVTAAASSEIYDIVKVDYVIMNQQKSLDSLKLVCLKKIKDKVKSYEIIGFKLDTMRKVFNDDIQTIYPQTRYASYQAYSKNTVKFTKEKSSSAYSYNVAPKLTTHFYNPVANDQYDIVINPLITTPVIQMSYSISIKYFLKPEKKADKYFIINSKGEKKEIEY